MCKSKNKKPSKKSEAEKFKEQITSSNSPKTILGMKFTRCPRKPTWLKISPEKWKNASQELKEKLEDIDINLRPIMDELFEEFSTEG